MKMYDPIRNNSFVMQFGFKHPYDNRQYDIIKKNDRRKSSSNISKLNEQVFCTK